MTTKFNTTKQRQRSPATCKKIEHVPIFGPPSKSCPAVWPSSLLCWFNAEFTDALGYCQQTFRVKIFDHGFQSYHGEAVQYTVISGLWYLVDVVADFDYFLPGCDIQCSVRLNIHNAQQLLFTGWSDVYDGGTPVYYDAGRRPSTLGNGFADPIFGA